MTLKGPEQTYKIVTPYCEEAEYRWWLFLTDRLSDLTRDAKIEPVNTHVYISSNVQTRYLDARTSATLVEKPDHSSRYGLPTGLVVAGIFSGYLVDRFNGDVRVGRPVAVDGAKFNQDKARQHITKLNINPSCAQKINEKIDEMYTNQHGEGFQNLLLLLLQLHQVTVDEKQFLFNINSINLRGKK